MKEKIVLRLRNSRYQVVELVNRLTPEINSVLDDKQVENILMEAKRKDVTVIIKG